MWPANTQRYSIQLQSWPPRASGQGVYSYNCRRMRTCTGTENAHPSLPVNSTPALPGPGQETEQRAQPWRPASPGMAAAVLGPHCGPTLTSAAASPPFGHALHGGGSSCQNPVRAAGWRCWEPPVLRPSPSYKQGLRSVQTRLRTGPVLGT